MVGIGLGLRRGYVRGKTKIFRVCQPLLKLPAAWFVRLPDMLATFPAACLASTLVPAGRPDRDAARLLAARVTAGVTHRKTATRNQRCHVRSTRGDRLARIIKGWGSKTKTNDGGDGGGGNRPRHSHAVAVRCPWTCPIPRAQPANRIERRRSKVTAGGRVERGGDISREIKSERWICCSPRLCVTNKLADRRPIHFGSSASSKVVRRGPAYLGDVTGGALNRRVLDGFNDGHAGTAFLAAFWAFVRCDALRDGSGAPRGRRFGGALRIERSDWARSWVRSTNARL